MTTPTCRGCGGSASVTMVDLGAMPLANTYPDHADAQLPSHPLHVRVCPDCMLAQVHHEASPEEIFSDYAYFSSVSTSWLEHSRALASTLVERQGLDDTSLVVELASNDGYLLRWFQELGIQVLGVEPAGNVAEVAIEAGVPTRVAFFGADEAARMSEEGVAADVVVANNVLAHVPDLRGFLAGIRTILRPSGVTSIEFPHLAHLLDGVQFDTIYHEHFSYFSLTALRKIMRLEGLEVIDVVELPTHGGSLRVHAMRQEDAAEPDESVGRVLVAESAAGVDGLAAYEAFAARVDACCNEFIVWLRTARAQGRRVAAYGAAAKGNTFLNRCGVTAADIHMVADRSNAKQGRHLPGSDIPIVAPSVLLDDAPDDLLILPWNLRDEIADELRADGLDQTRFWTAIPQMMRT